MFKLNKATHMLILMTFTIVFVVVYLYYMIRDVKKIYAEVKTHTTELANLKSLAAEVQEIKTVVSGLASSPPPAITEAMFLQQFIPQPPPAPPSVKPDVVISEKAVVDDDIESVATDDIKKLVEDDEEPEVHDNDEIIKADLKQDAPFTEDSLKKMKMDEIKEICKKQGITIKGTRESLIAKILQQ